MDMQQTSTWQRWLTILHDLRDRSLGPGASRRAQRVKEVVTVDCSPESAYCFWRDEQNLPRFMSRLESVQRIDERRARWLVKSPGGVAVAFEVETTEDHPNERIAWRTIGGPRMAACWSVRFTQAPGGRGTEIHVELQHGPPESVIAATIAKLFGGIAERRLASDLRRFKQIMETGEVVRADGVHLSAHAARPFREAERKGGAPADGPKRTEPAPSTQPGGGAR